MKLIVFLVTKGREKFLDQIVNVFEKLFEMSSYIQNRDFLNDWGSAFVYQRMASQVTENCIKVESL